MPYLEHFIYSMFPADAMIHKMLSYSVQLCSC